MVKVCIQRVKSASVDVLRHGIKRRVASIENGLLVLVGLTHDDNATKIKAMAKKLCNLRLWPNLNDPSRGWDSNVVSNQYKILLVSQFTMYAITKGTKPDFHQAMPPETARKHYYDFVDTVKREYKQAAGAIPGHKMVSTPTTLNGKAYPYSAIHDRIEDYYVGQSELPPEEQDDEYAKLSHIDGLELFDFDEFVQTTVFGADMDVSLVNDGPVTMILESPMDVKDNQKHQAKLTAQSQEKQPKKADQPAASNAGQSTSIDPGVFIQPEADPTNAPIDPLVEQLQSIASGHQDSS